METIVLIVHVLLAAAIIAFVLLQQGKGAEAGASFGGGASQTVFGSSGNASFLAKVTGLLATGLFVTSFLLAIYAKEKAVTVTDLGVPSTQAIEAQNTAAESELPALESESPAAPADADVPAAE